MKNKINEIYLLLLLGINIYYIKCDYVIFELDTYKNKSNYDEEQINYFYESVMNKLYSKISLGQKNTQYIMEIKINTIGLTIYNYNCDIPPLNSDSNPPLLPNFAESITIDHIEDNDTQIYGEYFVYILNNTMNIKTEKEEKKIYVDYLFSQRNNSEYINKDILRPYTCFNLGFHLMTKDIIDDEYALNLIFQLKKKDIINSYNWFIEYDSENKDKAKLILGVKPYEYNKEKYKEENDKTIEAEKRLDKIIYWDVKMSEIYLMKNNEKQLIEGYYTCSLEPSLGVIVGVIGYKLYVEDNLFKPLIKQQKCFKEKNIFNKYIIYYCNKDMKDILKKSEAVKLYFYHRFFGKTFELNFEDLFEEKNNFIFFKIFFDEEQNDIWRLGKPFLIKYFFSYNFDGKTISYYNLEENEDNKGTNIKTELIVVIIILALIFLGLGFFLGKYIVNYRKNKKKKAEELLEDENIGEVNINE
jgi:hypothetical protein